MYPAVIFLSAGNPCRGEPLNLKGKHSFPDQGFVNQGVAEADWEWQVQRGVRGREGVEDESTKGGVLRLQKV